MAASIDQAPRGGTTPVDRWLCIVFDIDQTLIDDEKQDADTHGVQRDGFVFSLSSDDRDIYVRPGAADLLAYCFAHAKGVAVWTRASKQWADAVLALPVFVPFRDKFAFVWSAEECRSRWTRTGTDVGMLSPPIRSRDKPLAKIWKKGRFRAAGWRPRSTLIIDDTPANFQCNYGNGIRVPPYLVTFPNAASDRVLWALRDYLDATFNPSSKVRNVRFTEKRGWLQQRGT